MPAGERNKRLTIERPVRVRNTATNETVDQWEEVATVWAQVLPLTANERVRAKQAQLTLTHKIKLNYTSLLTSDCRLRYATAGEPTPRTLNILGIVNVGERNRELEVTAIEVRGGYKKLKTKIELIGEQELKKFLVELPKRVIKKALKQAVTAGATPIVKSVRSKTPSLTGLLRKSVTKRVKTYPNGNAVAFIGASKEVGGKGPDGRNRVPQFYWHLIVGGTSKLKGNNALEDGFNATRSQSQKLMEDKLKSVTAKEAAKLKGKT